MLESDIYTLILKNIKHSKEDNNMGRIVLEVNSELAKSWRNAPARLRQTIEKEIEKRIAKEIAASERSKFFNLLDKVQEKAEKKGLTQEKLDQILDEE